MFRGGEGRGTYTCQFCVNSVQYAVGKALMYFTTHLRTVCSVAFVTSSVLL